MLHLKLRPELFWDLNIREMNEQTHQRIIIERVITLGNLDEWKEIVNFYGLDDIKSAVINAGTLDPKTMSFIESYLGIPKEQLRCYTKKQSAPQYWT